jgi:hypothetical protein
VTWFSWITASTSGAATARLDAARAATSANDAVAIRAALAGRQPAPHAPHALLSYDEAVDLVCRATGWPIGHVWVCGSESWKSSGAWHDDGPQFADLKASTAVTDLGSGRGIVAAVLHLEACRFMPDLSGLGSTVRHQHAVDAGLVAVVGVPLRRGEKIEAIFEFITTAAVEPDNDLSDALLAVAARSRRSLPATNLPATNQPATNQPATNQPATNQPATNLPAPRRTVSLDVEHPVDLAG